MNVNLIVEADRPPLTRLEFEETSPPYSIAADGYVTGGPWYNPKGPRRNFNHHEDVDRLSTRSTSDQVNMALCQGLYEAFRVEGIPTAHVHFGDCDEDVCTTWTQLNNPHIIRIPSFNRILNVVDKMDTTAGSYPIFKDSLILEETAWIYQPYRQFRNSGGLARRNSSEFKSVIEDVENRMLMYVVGRGKAIPIDTRYDRVGGGKGWVMVKEIGAQSRIGMFSDGIGAFVSIRDAREDRFDYVIGKRSEYDSFPIGRIATRLNLEENITGKDTWGPCQEDTIICGSPRVRGSKLNPDKLASIVEDEVKNSKPVQ